MQQAIQFDCAIELGAYPDSRASVCFPPFIAYPAHRNRLALAITNAILLSTRHTPLAQVRDPWQWYDVTSDTLPLSTCKLLAAFT